MVTGIHRPFFILIVTSLHALYVTESEAGFVAVESHHGDADTSAPEPLHAALLSHVHARSLRHLHVRRHHAKRDSDHRRILGRSRFPHGGGSEEQGTHVLHFQHHLHRYLYIRSRHKGARQSLLKGNLLYKNRNYIVGHYNQLTFTHFESICIDTNQNLHQVCDNYCSLLCLDVTQSFCDICTSL